MTVITWESLEGLGKRQRGDLSHELDFDSIRQTIFKLSYSLTLDYSIAEDVAQDCLIKVWQHQWSAPQI